MKVRGKEITFVLLMMVSIGLYAQNASDKKSIYTLIDLYSQAREKSDTILLKEILTEDIDQLVSSGEWRDGIQVAVQGMLRSSQTNSGSRKLVVDKIRFLDSQNAITDCRYEIKNANGSERKMWSTFIVVKKKNQWKIAAIRNMLPAPSR